MNSLNIMKFGFRFVAAGAALLLTAVPLLGQASVGGPAGKKVTALDGTAKKGGDQLEIRIANRSRLTIENVRVHFPSQTEDYGTIPPNGVTDYRVVKKAYRYALIKAVVAGVPAGFIPIDYVGERELKAGRYTYVLTIDARATSKYYGLKLKLRKE